MKPLSDDKIIDSWKRNAAPWIKTIRNKEIQSRELITNQAIINAVTQHSPNSVIDIGCGEGWLVRELTKRGINTLGVDVVPELIDYANKSAAGRFKTLSYKELASDGLTETFDLAVCNFSLLGNESVTHLFQTIPSLLNPNGYFVVQTLHPITACGEQEYKDGWREGSWDGFSDQFTDPAPWYFRTTESWQGLFANHDLQLKETIEPIDPQTNQPVSLLLIGVCNN